jgi:ribose transport system substrate-binding protein
MSRHTHKEDRMQGHSPLRRAGASALAVGVLFGAAALAGCGDSDDNASTASTGTAASTGASAEHYDITLIQGVKGDAFYGSMACGAKAAADKLGASLEIQGPDKWDPSLQTPIVNAVVAKKPDAILIAPNDAKAMFAPIKAAADAGIKIVLVDTTLEHPDMAVSQVTSDNRAAGAIAAKEVAKEAGANGSVLTVDVQPGITTTADRVNGFREEAKKLGLQDLGVQYTGDDPSKAASVVTSTLAKHSDLAGVFATNTLTGEGAATGLRSAQKEGKVKLIGFDANPSGVEALEKGVAQAQVVLKPLDIGYKGVEQAVNALQGKPTQEKILTGSLIATKHNLSDPQVKKYLYSDNCTQ